MRIINGFNDYNIYPKGRCWSIKRRRFLKPGKDKGEYLHYSLSHQGKKKTIKVHRLVAEHFIPNPHNLPVVDHIDGDRQNNDISNLRWVSQLQNCNAFQKNRSNNTSGYKNISFDNNSKQWRYEKTRYKKVYQKYFKTLPEAIAYKFAFNLLIRIGRV